METGPGGLSASAFTERVRRLFPGVAVCVVVAFAARSLLAELDLLAPKGSGPGRHRFLSSGDIEWFRILGELFPGKQPDELTPADWGIFIAEAPGKIVPL